MSRAIRLAAAAAVLLLAGRADAAPRTAPQIWLTPLSSAFSPDGKGEPDVLALIASPAAWPRVSARTSVVKLYPYFVGHVPDAVLADICGALKRRKIGLALEARVLDKRSPCGGDGGDWTLGLLAKLKRDGGDLDYLAMDEPVLHWKAAAGCTATEADLARDVARKLASYRRVFPRLRFGDIEPVALDNGAKLTSAEILRFLDAYAAADGAPLAFFHADVVWTFPWLRRTLELMQEVHRRGMRFGVIYNGLDFAATDAAWSQEAVDHFTAFERAAGRSPDAAVFQTWVGHPARALPESDPTTLTGIAAAYLDSRPR